MSAGYVEIAARYRAQITEGRLRPGDRLPTLRAVMREYGVAQQTASRAYSPSRRPASWALPGNHPPHPEPLPTRPGRGYRTAPWPWPWS
ncbi:GntR family transcriptional regulator [Streptomyces sp. XY431]|uniref:GntR family transcriptional regulator n=1 Tax=Streptomyces sp. XY431 TaxID=1415562 RepID=UPI002573BA4D|nr:GntR family transcriptional regulator [Streptomyces sp. XY431]